MISQGFVTADQWHSWVPNG